MTPHLAQAFQGEIRLGALIAPKHPPKEAKGAAHESEDKKNKQNPRIRLGGFSFAIGGVISVAIGVSLAYFFATIKPLEERIFLLFRRLILLRGHFFPLEVGEESVEGDHRLPLA